MAFLHASFLNAILLRNDNPKIQEPVSQKQKDCREIIQSENCGASYIRTNSIDQNSR